MMPSCPYSHPDGQKHLMFPRVTDSRRVQYFCPACLAAGPLANTFSDAKDKAVTRAEPALVWHNRVSDPPKKPGRYLCKYVFTKAQEAPETAEMPFYSVLDWYAQEDRFQNETEAPEFHGMRFFVLAWMDYEGGKTA